MALMREQLDRMSATSYERFCTYLTAYSESDFYNDRFQVMQDGVNKTIGMFQQSARWGWTGLTDIPKATKEFLEAFRAHPKIAKGLGEVRACYLVQKWNAPDPEIDWPGWYASPETKNYLRRLNVIDPIMADPLYFTNKGKK